MSSLESVDLADTLRHFARVLEQAHTRPHGPEANGDDRTLAGQACLTLMRGDQTKAIGLWRKIEHRCGGYFPSAVAQALILASDPRLIEPDPGAPEVN